MSLLAVSSFAADRHIDLTAFATQVDTNSKGTFNADNPNQPFDINFNGKLGYGVGVNLFLGSNFSAELTGSEVQPKTDLRQRITGAATTSPSVKMIPLTGVLQFHFAPKGAIDPYIGAGVAYVLFDDLSNASDLDNVGVNKIKFKDDAGFCANAGLGFRITPNFAITVDGKYVPLNSSATAVFANNSSSTTTKVKINPVMFSAGLTWRF